jgi:hypothetical protein
VLHFSVHRTALNAFKGAMNLTPFPVLGRNWNLDPGVIEGLGNALLIDEYKVVFFFFECFHVIGSSSIHDYGL